MRRWRTLVRARAASAAEAAFSEPTVAFDDALAMSHNAGFACDADGSTLLAYGGLGNWAFDTAPNGRAEPGVYRTTATATLPPLQWSPPVLAVTGNKTATGCREERAGWERCEYDGKISVARFRGRVWLYLRANMIGGGGARHVEATSSRDGIRGWSRHVPIEVDGYAAGRRENNLYFFAVQRLRRRGDAAAAKARLVAAFPAVFHRQAGVYLSTSGDGLRWSRPVRVFQSDVLADWRSGDHPVDGSISWAGAEGGCGGGGEEITMWVQRDVDMRDYGTLRGRQPRVHASFDETCARWPSVCEVAIPLSATIPLEATTPERSGITPPPTPTPAVEVQRVHELSASYVPCAAALASAVATERAAQFRRDLAKFDAQVRRLQCSGAEAESLDPVLRPRVDDHCGGARALDETAARRRDRAGARAQLRLVPCGHVDGVHDAVRLLSEADPPIALRVPSGSPPSRRRGLRRSTERWSTTRRPSRTRCEACCPQRRRARRLRCRRRSTASPCTSAEATLA